MSEPTVSVTVERRKNLGRYEHENVSIGIYRIPWNASADDIQHAIDTGDLAAAMLQDAVGQRINQLQARFDALLDSPVSCPNCGDTLTGTDCERCASLIAAQIEPAEPVAEPEPAEPPIPHDDEVSTPDELKLTAFGVTVDVPWLDWMIEPITEINRDGTGGGQLKALNTALGVAGFKGKDRHWASLALLQAFYGALGRVQIDSLKELTRGEAHVLLEWFEQDDPEAILGVSLEASKLKGYIPPPARTAQQAEPEPDEPEYASIAEPIIEPVIEIAPDALATTEPQGFDANGYPNEFDPFDGRMGDEFAFSDDQQNAIDRILSAQPGEFLFVTGNAGAGKSTIIHHLRKQKAAIIVAPTGLAAINAGGETIHRFFGFRMGPLGRGDAPRLTGSKESVVRHADLIIIDEISMVRADIMDAVNASLQKTMGNRLPFGGKTIVAVGDMWQLEPVVPTSPGKDGGKSVAEWIIDRYDSPFWFDAHVFRGQKNTLVGADELGKVVTLNLTHIFRQSDPEFIEALNLIRVGDPAGLFLVNTRVKAPEGEVIHLTLTNEAADSTNARRLAELDGEAKTYTAQVTGDWSERDLKDVASPAELHLKVGARVMFTRNSRIEGYASVVNGDIGTVTRLTESGPVVAIDRGEEILVQPAKWERKRYGFDTEKDTIVEVVDGEFQQYPLKLAWAVTTHKSQGQTLDAAMLELERRSFAHGQLYVALSRVRSMDGLYLRRKLTSRDIEIAPRIREFCGPAALTPQFSMEALA